jgi:hypothetical protein
MRSKPRRLGVLPPFDVARADLWGFRRGSVRRFLADGIEDDRSPTFFVRPEIGIVCPALGRRVLAKIYAPRGVVAVFVAQVSVNPHC